LNFYDRLMDTKYLEIKILKIYRLIWIFSLRGVDNP
jgi:hypothetical protein